MVVVTSHAKQVQGATHLLLAQRQLAAVQCSAILFFALIVLVISSTH